MTTVGRGSGVPQVTWYDTVARPSAKATLGTTVKATANMRVNIVTVSFQELGRRRAFGIQSAGHAFTRRDDAPETSLLAIVLSFRR